MSLKKNILTTLLIIIAYSCDSDKRKNIPDEPQTIVINKVQLLNDVFLSSIVDTACFIKLQPNAEDANFRIKKIEFSKNFIFVLWENSNSISVYDRIGNFRSDLKKSCNKFSLGDPINFTFDIENDQLYILYSDGIVVICRLDLEGTVNSTEAKQIPIETVIDILKIPGESVFGLSLHNSDVDFLLTNDLLLKSKKTYTKAKVTSKSNKEVILRNSFISDGKTSCFRKYMNDTIYKLSDSDYYPFIAFDFLTIDPANNQVDSSNVINNLAHADFFFIVDSTFYLKYSERRKEYFLIRDSNRNIWRFLNENMVNDVYGSLNFNCIGVDPISKSFVFYVPSLTLDRFFKSDVICKDYYSVVQNLNPGSDDNLILLLIKF